MTQYEVRLTQDIRAIRSRIAEVGSDVESALKDAVHSVLQLDADLAAATVLGDLSVNRRLRGVDRMCHSFVARHLPSAGHLRFVSSVLRLSVALERIGDYAVTIAREAARLTAAPPTTVSRDIDLLSDQNRGMLRQALRAFDESNADLALGTMGMAKQLAATYDRVFADLLREGDDRERPIRDLFAHLVIFNRLGRVGDQAKNICEETVFTVTGETKKPKVYRVLFLDEKDELAAPLAAAYAKHAYPDAGRYGSAGWNAGAQFDPQVQAFVDERGYELPGDAPRPLDRIRENLDEFHVVVGLGRGARERLGEAPFHTVVLEWDLSEGLEADSGPESLRRELAGRIQGLMEVLHGDEAE